ncbi:MAG TPA: hypothetical protein VI893_05095 [Thermoplasmata archaeon]|nr:hypothetical protein [Thermoplasmata archaeon]
MAVSEMVTLRIPPDKKRMMEQLGPDLNWSEELRKLLDKRLRQLAREKARSLSEEAMRGLPPVPRGTSARLIREDRDAR